MFKPEELLLPAEAINLGYPRVPVCLNRVLVNFGVFVRNRVPTGTRVFKPDTRTKGTDGKTRVPTGTRVFKQDAV